MHTQIIHVIITIIIFAYHYVREGSVSWLIKPQISCYNGWEFNTDMFQSSINLSHHFKTIPSLHFYLRSKRSLKEKEREGGGIIIIIINKISLTWGQSSRLATICPVWLESSSIAYNKPHP